MAALLSLLSSSGFGAFNIGNDDDAAYSRMQAATDVTVSASILVHFLLRTLDVAISSLQSMCQGAVALDAERRFLSSDVGCWTLVRTSVTSH